MWWIYALLDLIDLKWVSFMPQVQPVARLTTYSQHAHAECTHMNITCKHRSDTEHSHGAHPTSICVGWRYTSEKKNYIYIHNYTRVQLGTRCQSPQLVSPGHMSPWGCSCRPCTDTETHTYTHTQGCTGFHSLRSLQSLPHGHLWSDCNCWHPDPGTDTLNREPLTQRNFERR